jgi:tetratricopeptide (TPR) repeat protein
MDRFLEQAAGAVLVADGKAESPADLSAALEELGEHPLAEEIVEVALSRRVDAKGRDYLWAFIDAAPAGAAKMAGEMAGELVGRLVEETGDAERIAAELVGDPSEGDLWAAMKAGEYLYGETQFQLEYTFLGAVVDGVGDALPASGPLADLIRRAANAADTVNEWKRCAEWSKRALRMNIEIFGREPHKDVAISHCILGNLYSRLKEYDKARHHHEESLEINLKLFGEEHSSVATSDHNLGVLFSKFGELAKARECLGKALATRLKVFSEEHADVASTRAVLVDLDCNDSTGGS